jgi:hypothetical protein
MVGVCAGGLAALALLSAGLFTRNNPSRLQAITPVLTIITAPTATTTQTPSATLLEAHATASPSARAGETGEITLGQLVEVFGTGSDGLRLRVQPGLSARSGSLGVESEVFEVLGGPEQIDGYQWWFLGNPFNAEKTGWAVSIYLRSITSP